MKAAKESKFIGLKTYTHSFKMGVILHLLICIKSISRERGVGMRILPFLCLPIFVCFRFLIMFCMSAMMGKSPIGVRDSFHTTTRPHILEMHQLYLRLKRMTLLNKNMIKLRG